MKKMLSTLLSVLLLANFVFVNVYATTAPHCNTVYDSSYASDCIKYYTSTDDSTQDTSRLVKFKSGKLTISTSDTVITSNHLSTTNPGWTTDGSKLFYIEKDNTLKYYTYSTKKSTTVANIKAKSLVFNTSNMVTSVTLTDGTKKTVSATLTTSTATSSETALKKWTDSAGQIHITFDGNTILIIGKNVYLNNYIISELANKVVVTKAGKVFIYDDTKSLFRFNPANPFISAKIKFQTGVSFKDFVTNTAGYMTKVTVVSSKGKETSYTPSQLAVDKIIYPTISYVINNPATGYCTYHIAERDTVHKMKLVGKKLYANEKLVAKGIERSRESYGYKGNYGYYLKGSIAYKFKISTPKKSEKWQTGVKKFKYSTRNGQISGVVK